MNTKEVEVKESPGVEFAKAMLERKRQAQKEAIEEYNNPDSELRKRVEKLKKENAERGTPVVVLNSLENPKDETIVEKSAIESPGVKFSKALLESQRKTAEEALEEYQTNPEIKKLVNELKKRNAERGSPVGKL